MSESVGAWVASLNFLIKTPIAEPFIGEREPGGALRGFEPSLRALIE